MDVAESSSQLENNRILYLGCYYFTVLIFSLKNVTERGFPRRYETLTSKEIVNLKDTHQKFEQL